MTKDDRFDGPMRGAIIAGCLVAFIGFGFSAAFGVFLRPMSADLGWGREVFALSLAVQALFWGLAQPLAGMVADKYGAARVLFFGAIVAALGFLLRGLVIDPTVFVASGIVAGIGTGACSFPVVIVALGKVVSARRRSFVMGLGTASASAGMLVAAPLSSYMIGAFGWQTAILVIAASFLLILPTLGFIARVSRPAVYDAAARGIGDAVRTAFSDRSFVLLFTGFLSAAFMWPSSRPICPPILPTRACLRELPHGRWG